MDFAESAETRGEMGVVLRSDVAILIPQILRIFELFGFQQSIITLHYLRGALRAIGVNLSFGKRSPVIG